VVFCISKGYEATGAAHLWWNYFNTKINKLIIMFG
jgi:hypothetical protein